MKPRRSPGLRVVEHSRVHGRMYRANSTARDFKHRGVTYHGVAIDWFVRERQGPLVSHRDIIDGYSEFDGETRLDAEQAVDELFAESEIDALKAHLAFHHDDDSFKAVEIPIPISNETAAGWIPNGTKPVGGTAGFLKIDTSYTLPFRVWGYFDLPGHGDSEAAGPAVNPPSEAKRTSPNRATVKLG